MQISSSYDVKSFLNYKKKKKGFISITVKSSAIGFAAFGLAIILLLSVCFKTRLLSAGVGYINKWGVYNALPFLSSERGSKSEKLWSMINDNYPVFAMPLVNFDKPEKSDTVKEKKSPKINYPTAIEEKVVANGVEIKNETAYPVDVKSILAEGVTGDRGGHRVLIVHTHASESYTPTADNSYTHTGNYRTQDTRYNMIRIGDELAEALKSKGVEVIHDKTINDYPSYNDSYNKTEQVIKDYLKTYPDIGYVFDIHRDAVGSSDSPVKFVTEIHGVKASQVMTVCGTDTNLDNPDWRQNLALAVHIQNYFDVNYTGLLRPLNLRKERFNMHLTNGSLLFEIGTNGNTLEESLYSARLLGEGLGEIIRNLKNNG